MLAAGFVVRLRRDVRRLWRRRGWRRKRGEISGHEVRVGVGGDTGCRGESAFVRVRRTGVHLETMKTAKQATLELVHEMPDGVSFRVILSKLAYLSRIEEGVAEADRGEVVSNEQVMEELRQWRPSSGR